jgi:hypothetical protein
MYKVIDAPNHAKALTSCLRGLSERFPIAAAKGR